VNNAISEREKRDIPQYVEWSKKQDSQKGQ